MPNTRTIAITTFLDDTGIQQFIDLTGMQLEQLVSDDIAQGYVNCVYMWMLTTRSSEGLTADEVIAAFRACTFEHPDVFCLIIECDDNESQSGCYPYVVRNDHEIKSKTTERGWPGHFILCDRCMFRRNTLVEFGDQRVVVSTVGRMWSKDRSQLETVGHEKHFETTAFPAIMKNGYWEADTCNEIELMDQKSHIFGDEPERSGEANDMHDDYVAAVCLMLEQ